MSTAIEKIYSAFLNGSVICTDTRNILEGCIFFALKGENFNGNTFVKSALESGAAYAVADEITSVKNDRVIVVENVLNFLQQLSNHHRRQLKIPFVGITGSNGKTTTKELLNKVLSKKFNTLCTKGNLNNHIGVPLTLLAVTASHEMAIIEMGANHQKEIELLCSLAEPTHVLITNVGKAHLEGFGGFEGVKKGKGEMYVYAKNHHALVFINDGDAELKEMLGNYEHTMRYGTSVDCDVTAKLIEKGSHVSLQWKPKSSYEWSTLDTRITGVYNFENIISAITAGIHFGVPPNDINQAVASYIPDNQRSQELVRGSNHIILDAYNANPTSMNAALNNFNEKFSGIRAVMLGDMFELGEESPLEHQAISDKVAALHFDLIIFVGPKFKATTPVSKANYFETSAEAASWLKAQKLSGHNILIKGSRGSKMEVMLEAIN